MRGDEIVPGDVLTVIDKNLIPGRLSPGVQLLVIATAPSERWPNEVVTVYCVVLADPSMKLLVVGTNRGVTHNFEHKIRAEK